LAWTSLPPWRAASCLSPCPTACARRPRSRGDEPPSSAKLDPRVAALVGAIRQRKRVRIRSKSNAPQEIHPVGLTLTGEGWEVQDACPPGRHIPLAECEDINISARTFEAARCEAGGSPRITRPSSLSKAGNGAELPRPLRGDGSGFEGTFTFRCCSYQADEAWRSRTRPLIAAVSDA